MFTSKQFMITMAKLYENLYQDRAVITPISPGAGQSLRDYLKQKRDYESGQCGNLEWDSTPDTNIGDWFGFVLTCPKNTNKEYKEWSSLYQKTPKIEIHRVVAIKRSIEEGTKFPSEARNAKVRLILSREFFTMPWTMYMNESNINPNYTVRGTIRMRKINKNLNKNQITY